ncbi:MAG: ribonuclease H-like domain-containing protein [Nocardioidaceae bacterium]|nr:ribonuclease H-like domain-containing protein [Nocardioidaceae bacterium]MCO5325328.1 ribonuclease H-like domain-containing protein [Nocardioidaceae bacterium]
MSAPEPKPLLNAHAARRCARRTHNEFDETIPKAPWEPPASVQALFDAGIAFEARVFDALRALHGDSLVDLTNVHDSASRIDATTSAMAAGAGIIIGGQLPDDPVGQRTGRPDVLLKDPASGPHHRYWPVDIKHHVHANAAKQANAWASKLSSPTMRHQVAFTSPPARSRNDTFQLAHYARMLQACGRLAGDGTWGAIIGTREIYPDQLALVWHDLDNEFETTFSRSQGRKDRSVMDRYDHEHAFRAKVAAVAAQRHGLPTDPDPLVQPIGQSECARCPFLDWCADEGSDLASWALSSGRLSVREWQSLSRLGHKTTQQIADLRLDDDLLSRYLPEVTHITDPERRLRDAIRRCRLITTKVEIEALLPGKVHPPRRDIEIDLDCEWDSNDIVYLWGARIRDRQGSEYVSFCSFDDTDPGVNSRLATELVTWLRSQVQTAQARGQSIAIFHWAKPEPRKLRDILGADAVDDLIEEHFIDLLDWSRGNLFSVHGHSLKTVAPLTGFRWQQDDADGLASQEYIVRARLAGSDADEARRWLLSYNEDDVAAMAHFRDHIAATVASG